MANKYAVIESSVVVNLAEATPEFAQLQGWIDIGDNPVNIGWLYIDGAFSPPLPPDYTQENKEIAVNILQSTDWTTIPDVSNPEVSNPYLTNASEFAVYRNQVRAIAINPPATKYVFPEAPSEQWSS